MSFTVESGITYIPPERVQTKETQTRVNWPFSEMNHGDSFIIPNNQANKVGSAVSSAVRRGKLPNTVSYKTKPIDSEYHRVWLFNI
jgi:hypothetical protein